MKTCVILCLLVVCLMAQTKGSSTVPPSNSVGANGVASGSGNGGTSGGGNGGTSGGGNGGTSGGGNGGNNGGNGHTSSVFLSLLLPAIVSLVYTPFVRNCP